MWHYSEAKLNIKYSYFLKTIISVFLITGTITTIYGLLGLSHSELFSWSDIWAFARFCIFLITIVIFVYLLAKKLKLQVWMASLIVAVSIIICTGNLWPFLAILWFAISSFILGDWLIGKFKSIPESKITILIIGIGIYGTIIEILAHFPVNYPLVYSILLALPIIIFWSKIKTHIQEILSEYKKIDLEKKEIKVIDIAIFTAALFYLVIALMPENGFDSLMMHLFVPEYLAIFHSWGFSVETYAWAVMPMLGDWIFSISNMIAGETATRLTNIGFIFILCALLWDIIKWFGGSSSGAKWAILLFLVTPLTFTEGSSLYIESVWAVFIIAGTIAVLKSCFSSEKSHQELPVAGILLGFACATKAVTFMAIPVLIFILIIKYKSWLLKINIRTIAASLGLFIFIGSIPYIVAWILTGNPIFPFFNAIFHSPYFLQNINIDIAKYSNNISWDLLYKVTFESEKYLEASAGAPGFQWILLLIPSCVIVFFSKNKKTTATLLVAFSTILLTFHSQTYLRYIFPSVILLVSILGLTLDDTYNVDSPFKKILQVITVIVIILNILFINSGNGFYRDFPLVSIKNGVSREQYIDNKQQNIDNHRPIRNAVKLLNLINKDTPVAVFSSPLMAGLSSDALYPIWQNLKFQQEVVPVKTEQDMADILVKRNVRFVVLDSDWDWSPCCNDRALKFSLVKKITEPVMDYGPISVRKIKSDYYFKKELLTNPDFMFLQGWILSPGAIYDSEENIILASEKSPAYQTVPVLKNTRYLNSVTFRCAKKQALGRVQINWLDEKGEFISTNIKTFECLYSWDNYSMEVISPEQAVYAHVYVSGNSSVPLEFKMNSLRQ